MNLWEILLILLVALVVIKPERFPEIAYTLGRTMARLQKIYQELMQKIKQHGLSP